MCKPMVGLIWPLHRVLGVPEDYVQAYGWLNLAAAQGSRYARSRKSELAEQMTPSQIAEAQKLSTKLWEKIPRQ
jgi:TPR repeat protein